MTLSSLPTFYVAGPMTHRPQFNFPAFDAAAATLRGMGVTVVSPAELDDPEDRERAMASPDGAPLHYTYGKTHADFLARDLKIIAEQVDVICVLPEWEDSTGARIETFVGFAYGKSIVRLVGDSLWEVPTLDLIRAWSKIKDLSITAKFEVPA